MIRYFTSSAIYRSVPNTHEKRTFSSASWVFPKKLPRCAIGNKIFLDWPSTSSLLSSVIQYPDLKPFRKQSLKCRDTACLPTISTDAQINSLDQALADAISDALLPPPASCHATAYGDNVLSGSLFWSLRGANIKLYAMMCFVKTTVFTPGNLGSLMTFCKSTEKKDVIIAHL